MTLEVDKNSMTIMGVQFDSKTEFEGVWYAISSNMIEGFEPKKSDVEKLKDYAISRRGATVRG